MKNRFGRMNERGFTLVEIIFVALIFPIIFLGLFSMLDVVADTFYTGDIYHRLSESCMQTLRYLSREIAQTSPLVSPSHLTITADANGDSIVQFQMPVDWDNDGDVVTGDLDPTMEWGAYDQTGETTDGRLDGWIEYSVATHPTYGKQLHRKVLDSAMTEVDGLDQVVAANINSFSVSQNANTLSMTLSLQGTDLNADRTLNTTFTSETLLRNAVS